MSSDKVRWFWCAKWCSFRTFANNTCWYIAIVMWTGNWLPAEISLQYATNTLCALFTDRPVGPHPTDHSVTSMPSVSSALCILSLLHSDAAVVEIRNKVILKYCMGHQEISREMFEGYSNGLLPELVRTNCVDFGVPNNVLFVRFPITHADPSQFSCGREIGCLPCLLTDMLDHRPRTIPSVHCYLSALVCVFCRYCIQMLL